MIDKLEGYTRHLVGNRRNDPRRRVRLEAIVRDEGSNQIVFRGRTRDLSTGGCRILGLPVGLGVTFGQRVHVELVIPPKSDSGLTRKPTLSGFICRVIDDDAEYFISVAFDAKQRARSN